MAETKEKLLNKLRAYGFNDIIVLAFEKVRREDFILQSMKEHTYDDDALPIGNGQTISQPYTIAFMLKLLDVKKNQKVLEIGSGSGYVLALINEMAENLEIYGIERVKELAEKSKRALKNKNNIHIININGFKGLVNKAPFDRIIISASAKEPPLHLLEQIKKEGIMVSPVQNSIVQIKKSAEEIKLKYFHGFDFVLLIEEN